LPPGVLSGFPTAARTLRKHRADLPSVDTITISGIFALSTVRTSIAEAEKSFSCFGDLYRAEGRSMPSIQDLVRCFRGLQNTKAAMFAGMRDYAPVIRQVMAMGYQDRELRSVLALDSDLPVGLGLAKLSFTLALLGQDTICLDGRLLGALFKSTDRKDFERATGKRKGRVPEKALLTYEAAEDAFLEGNRFYDPRDPLGRARAQWQSWESVGKRGAEHGVWLDLLPVS